MTPRIPQILANAPRVFLGAFFLFASCHALVAFSDDESKAVDPHSETTSTEQTTKDPVGETPTEKPSEITTVVAPEGIRFMSYNIENYLTMERYIPGGGRKSTSKDPKEIAALVKIIVDEKPDILGICEIGTKDDLSDLQARLKKAGLDLPHTVHAGGIDTTRRLAILSAIPITSNNSQDKVAYQINGRDRMMGRGILDVTINLPSGPTHFIGLHLKSKRELREFDQAEIRLNEARLARKHCDALLAADPKARLVVYGDFNDTRKTPPLAMLMGNYRSQTYLSDVFAKDSRNHLWTHFWSYQQQYSRFDWVLTSPSLTSQVDKKKSYIVDPDEWNDASDHRAVLVTLKK